MLRDAALRDACPACCTACVEVGIVEIESQMILIAYEMQVAFL